MKISLWSVLFVLFFATSAFAKGPQVENTGLWITLENPNPVAQVVGESLEIKGEICKVKNKASKDVPNCRPISDKWFKVRAFFPDHTNEVTENLTVIKGKKNKRYFSYTTPALVEDSLNTLTIVVGYIQPRIRHFMKIQSKLDRKIQKLSERIEQLENDPNISPKKIKRLEKMVEILNRISSKIGKRVANQPELVAEYRLPLQVGNKVAGPLYYATMISGFKYQMLTVPGSLIQGESTSVQTRITNLRHLPSGLPEGSDLIDFHEELDDGTIAGAPQDNRDYAIDYFYKGNLVNHIDPQKLPEGSSIEYVHQTGKMSPEDFNQFKIQFYRKNKDDDVLKKWGRVQKVIPVAEDSTPPEWEPIELFPPETGGNVQTLGELSITVLDSFERLDPDSIQINISGNLPDGTPYDENITEMFTIVEGSNPGEFIVEGNLESLPEGNYTLEFQITDIAGNTSVQSHTFVIDRTPPVYTSQPEIGSDLGENLTPEITLNIGDHGDIDWTQLNLTLNGVVIPESLMTINEDNKTVTIQFTEAFPLASPLANLIKIGVVDKAGNASETTMTYTTNILPVAKFVATTSIGSISHPSIFDASTSTDDAPLNSFEWNFGDGATTTTNVPVVSHQYSNPGNYTVTLKVTDSSGASSSSTMSFYINYPPQAEFTSNFAEHILTSTFSFNGSTSSDPDNQIVEYEWNFGDGTIITGTQVNVNHVYQNAGNYTVSLKVTDKTGDFSVLSQAIIVHALPVAEFTLEPSEGIAPKEFIFDAGQSSSTAGIKNYTWNFGDGQADQKITEKTISHNFIDPNTYHVTLTVEDVFGGKTSVAHDVLVKVNKAPKANFITTSLAVCVGSNVILDASTSTDDEAVTRYVWNFGDGNSKETTGPIVSHVFNTSKEFLIDLTVYDRQGLNSTQRLSVYIRDLDTPPSASLVADVVNGNGPLKVNLDASASTDVAGNISSYQWNFGDGLEKITRFSEVKHTFQNPGTYTVILTAVNDRNLSDSKTLDIRVNHPPIAHFSTSLENGNPPLEINFFSKDSSDDRVISEFAWDFGDGNSEVNNSATISHVFAQSGDYTVKLSVTDDEGLTNVYSKSIHVNFKPVAQLSASITEGDYPMSVVFNAGGSTDDGNIVSYEWTWKEGEPKSITSVPDWTHHFDIPGTYDISVKVTDDLGLSDTKNITVVARPNMIPQPNFEYTTSVFKAPTDASLDASSSTDDHGITYYKWEIMGQVFEGADKVTVPFHFANAGTYPVTLTLTDTHGSINSIVKNVVIDPNLPPVADFISNTFVGVVPLGVFFDAEISSDDVRIVSYEWDFGNGEGTGKLSTSNITYIYREVGNYIVRLTVIDNHGATHSKEAIVQVATQQDPIEMNSPWLVFTPGSGVIPINTNQIEILITDESAIDYERLRVTLNNVEVPAEKIVVDNNLNKVIVVFDENFKLSTEQLNVLNVFIGDIHANITNKAASYTVSDSIEDSVGPLVNFNPSGGVLGTATVQQVTAIIADTSDIDYNSLQVQFNDVAVPQTQYQIDEENNKIVINFDVGYPLPNDDFSVLRVVISDINQNIGIGEVGFDTKDHLMVTISGPAAMDYQEYDYITSVVQGHFNCFLIKNGVQPATAIKCFGVMDEDVNNQDKMLTSGNAKYFDFKEEIIELSVGAEHGCVLTISGKAYCFGSEKFGRTGYTNLSDGFIGDNETPYDVGPLPFGEKVEHIYATHNHSCAVLEGGNVKCFGSSTVGINVADIPYVPVGEPIRELGIGGSVTCAITLEGKVKCWGLNVNAQTGYDPSIYGETIDDDETLQGLPYLNIGGEVKQVSIGTANACAVLVDGRVKCWGANKSTLGAGVNEIGNFPVDQVDFVQIGGDVSSVSVGSGIHPHICVVLEDQSAKCWGSNEFGQLGYGNSIINPAIGDNEVPAVTDSINIGEPVTQMIAGVDTTCAVLTDNSIKCWGRHDVSGVDKTVVTLGYNLGPNDGHLGDNEVPADFGPIDLSDKIALRYDENGNVVGTFYSDPFMSHIFCIPLADGKEAPSKVKCWGHFSTHNPDDIPASEGLVFDFGKKIKEIATSDMYVCALFEDKTIRCAGGLSIYYSSLGYPYNKRQIYTNSEIEAAGDIDIGGPVKHIYAFFGNTCAQMENNDVRCWGQNIYGQLGQGNTLGLGKYEPVSTINPIDIGEPIKEIDVGYKNVCALSIFGNVKCWGDNRNRVTGQSIESYPLYVGDDEPLIDVPFLNLGGPVKDVEVGVNHVCAIMENGNVKCWGVNYSGSLGIESQGLYRIAEDAEIIAFNEPVEKVWVGYYWSCARLESGGIKCWGMNTCGELGHGNRINQFVPDVLMNLGNDFVDFIPSREGPCAVYKNGKMKCWGGTSYHSTYQNITTVNYPDYEPLSCLGSKPGEEPSNLPYIDINNLSVGSKREIVVDEKLKGTIITSIYGDFYSPICVPLEDENSSGTEVYCYGDDLENDYKRGKRYSTRGVIIDLGDSPIELSSGGEHACALMSDQKVRCWGRNSSGQLGYGNTDTIGDDENVTSVPYLDIGEDVKHIYTGKLETCALTVTGNVKCWGNNQYGQLGYGHTDTIGDDEPLSSIGFVNVGEPVIQVAMTQYMTCALTESGRVKCWGMSVTPLDMGFINLEKTITQIAASEKYACGLAVDGEVVCWGDNSKWQLGGTLQDDKVTHVFSEKVVSITPNCAVLESGKVQCWGANDKGQLGLGHEQTIGDNENSADVGPVDIGEGLVQLIPMTKAHCGIYNSGRMKCWGYTWDWIYNTNAVGYSYAQTADLGDEPLEVPRLLPYVDFLGRRLKLMGENTSSIVASFTTDISSAPAPFKANFDANMSQSGVADIINYSWDFGDGVTHESVMPLASHEFTQVGVYVVKLVVSDEEGNYANYDSIVTVSQPNIGPTASFVINQNSGIAPLLAEFDAGTSHDPNGKIIRYEWDFGDGTMLSTATSLVSHNFTMLGVWPVTLTTVDDSGNKTKSEPQMIYVSTVNESPIPGFNCTLTDRTIECDASRSVDFDGTIHVYEWDFGDGNFGMGETVTHIYELGGIGIYDVQLHVMDNDSQSSYMIRQIKVDKVAPVIDLQINDRAFTNNSDFKLPITIYDDWKTITTVFLNGQVIFETDEKIIDRSVSLIEGISTVEIRCVDGAGNEAQSINFNVELDTTPPILANLVPAGGSIVDTMNFAVSGRSNEPLNKIIVNGKSLDLSSDRREFSGFISRAQEGNYSLEYIATDMAGNTSSSVLGGEVFVPILHKELITIVPDDTIGKVKIIGAPGSVRLPNHEVRASAGFFNNKTVSSAEDGSFELVLNHFEEVRLKSINPFVNRDDEVNLQYNVNTTLSGLVKDTDGNPLTGVTITIIDSGQSTVTDGNGAFSIASPATGDQKILFDGATIPANLRIPEGEAEPDRTFSKVTIAVSIGTTQLNTISTPIYLAPLKLASAVEVVDENTAVVVTSPEAEGVEIDIPAGKIEFPDGNNTGKINMAVVSKDRTSVPTLEVAEPDSVVALEPSGVKFSEPVELRLPNVNEFPTGTELVILSKNSEKGIWEIDGVATVSDNGQEIVTKEGMGITHFSEVYAAPLGAVFRHIGDKDKPGADTFNGALSTSIQLPSYKTMGQDVTQGLFYKSTWASPSAIVSNLFDIPRNRVVSEFSEGIRNFVVEAKSDVVVDSWIEPDLITAQFFSGDIVSEKMSFTGMPNKSVISYAMDLSSLETGIFPYISKYEIHLKQMILKTITIHTKKRFGGARTSQHTSLETRKIEEIFPTDVGGPLYVQNKINSNAGRGWKIGGVQKITNPESVRIMIEESSGEVASYTINNAIHTAYKNSNGISSVDLSNPNEVLVGNNSNQIFKVDLFGTNEEQMGTLPSFHGTYGAFGQRKWENDGEQDRCANMYYVINYSSSRPVEQLLRGPDNQFWGTDNKGLVFQFQNNNFSNIGGMIAAPDHWVNGGFCSWSGISCSRAYFLFEQVFHDENCPLHSPYPPSTGSVHQRGFADGNIGGARFSYLKGITAGLSANTMIVADNGNNRIRKIDFNNGTVSTIAGNGQTYDNGDGAMATDASIYHPRGLVYDDAGNLYISTERGYIRKIDNNGRIYTYAGNPNGRFVDVAHASEMKFSSPYGMVVDNENQFLYVADTGFNRIVQIDMQTKMARVVAGSGNCIPSDIDSIIGDGKSAVEASLCHPEFVGLDNDKNLIIADTGHSRIRRVTFDYSEDGKIAYVPGNKDNSELIRLVDGSFERVYRNGIIANFDKTGKQISITNKVGMTTGYEYDEQNRLFAIVDPVGSRTEYFYDGGLLSKIVDPALRETSFLYDGNLLQEVQFQDGSTRSFSYDENGQMLTETNQEGDSTSYSFNQWRRLQKVVRPDTSEIIMTDADSMSVGNDYVGGDSGELKSYGTDGDQLYDGIKDAKGVETKFAKDESGYVTEIIDGQGRITSIERDFDGRPTKITRPDETFAEFTYDVDIFNEETGDRIYKGTGDLLTKTDSSTGTKMSYEYNNYGDLINTRRNGELVSSSVYNENGQLLSKTNHRLNQTVSYAYNDRGLVETITDGMDRIKETSYDDFGNVILNEDRPMGIKTYYMRDDAGNVIQVENNKGQKTKYEFDLFNRMTAAITPNNERTEYSYRDTGELTQIKDPLNNFVTFKYNNMGRLVQKTDQFGETTGLKYDANGNLSQEIDPNGNEKTFEYDVLNQLVKKILPDNLYELSYDVRGNVTQVKNNYSQIDYTYLHHDVGELVSKVTSSGFNLRPDLPSETISYQYGAEGNRISMTNSAGTTTYGFDVGKRLTSVSNHNGENFGFSYDNVNRLSQVSRPGGVTKFNFDDSNFLTKILHQNNSSNVISFFEYSPDAVGNRIQTRTPSGNFNYLYDENNQILSATNPQITDSFASESFSYDSIGNRTSDQNQNYLYDQTKQRLTDDGIYLYFYDNNGNLTQKMKKPMGGEFTNFIYNSENQLVRMDAYSNATTKVREVRYTYDALGRRVEKKIINFNEPTKSFTRRFAYDGDEMLYQFDESNVVLAIYTHSGLRTDDMLAVEITTDGKNKGLAKEAKSYFYLKDGQGTVIDIADSGGNILQHHVYSAFGKLLKVVDADGVDISHVPVVDPYFTYTGRELDKESGLYYYRARYYEPALGRFLTSDPHPGELDDPMTFNNKYIYVLNNSTNYTDPKGLFGLFDFAIYTTLGIASLKITDSLLKNNWKWYAKNRGKIHTAVVYGGAITAGVVVGVSTGNPVLGAAVAGGLIGAWNARSNPNKSIIRGAMEGAALAAGGAWLGGAIFGGSVLGAVAGGAISGGTYSILSGGNTSENIKATEIGGASSVVGSAGSSSSSSTTSTSSNGYIPSYM